MIIVDHAGSGNHGCEALLRTTIDIMGKENIDGVFSSNPEEDIFYGAVSREIVRKPYLNKSEHFFKWVYYTVLAKIGIVTYAKKRQYYCLKEKRDLCIAIGGDNYCYDGLAESTAQSNIELAMEGFKTVLWGCSIDEHHLKDPKIRSGIKKYSLITARESLTFELLKKYEINNVKLCADPAFTLKRVDLPLPDNFLNGNTVGINVSPLITGLEKTNNITLVNYKRLIQYILENTDLNVALIPHVIWQNSDDREPLSQLFEIFKDTGRVCLIKDHNCMELKGYIARCRFFIGARTHATIAAYSSCVPTLVVGYSIKAKGIAKDLFGTYENYVIPVQELDKSDTLIEAFKWLSQNEKFIKDALKARIPDFVESAKKAKDVVLGVR